MLTTTEKSTQAGPVSGLSVIAGSALLDLAIRWQTEAELHDAEGNKDCGTGSDVPYALASICREHAKELESLAYVISSQNDQGQPRAELARPKSQP
jgi:hypothetical protein